MRLIDMFGETNRTKILEFFIENYDMEFNIEGVHDYNKDIALSDIYNTIYALTDEELLKTRVVNLGKEKLRLFALNDKSKKVSYIKMAICD